MLVVACHSRVFLSHYVHDVMRVKILKYVVEQQDRQYNHDALNCMFQLVAHGHDDMALQVYRSMRPTHASQESNDNNTLLRNMVIRGRVSICFIVLSHCSVLLLNGSQ